MPERVQGRNDVAEDVRNKPRKGKKHTYTDNKERKKARLDEAGNWHGKKKGKGD